MQTLFQSDQGITSACFVWVGATPSGTLRSEAPCEPPCGRLPSPVGRPAPVVALVVTVDALLNTDSGDDGVSSYLLQ